MSRPAAGAPTCDTPGCPVVPTMGVPTCADCRHRQMRAALRDLPIPWSGVERPPIEAARIRAVVAALRGMDQRMLARRCAEALDAYGRTP